MENKENLKSQYSQEARCTFKPQVNFTSEIICEADPRRGTESKDEKIARLFAKDQMKRELVVHEASKELY